MPPAGFEPAIPASVRPQTHALDRAATGIGRYTNYTLGGGNLNKPSFKLQSTQTTETVKLTHV